MGRRKHKGKRVLQDLPGGRKLVCGGSKPVPFRVQPAHRKEIGVHIRTCLPVIICKRTRAGGQATPTASTYSYLHLHFS
jgi:hypothetical protein